jgi:hypothetical protein
MVSARVHEFDRKRATLRRRSGNASAAESRVRRLKCTGRGRREVSGCGPMCSAALVLLSALALFAELPLHVSPS